MKDAFGVKINDTVEKAFALRPVADFVKGAASVLRTSQAGTKGAGLGAGIRQMGGAVKNGFQNAKAGMPKIPKPSSTQMKVGGAIGGTGLAAGATGYALGGRKNY